MTKKATTKKTTKKEQDKINLAKGKKFGKDNQPTPEAKKQGRNRKREAQRIMDKITELQDFTPEELKAYVKKNQKTLKIKEQIMMKYVEDILKSPKSRENRLDRHISKAPTQITGEGDKDFIPTEIKITIEK